MLDHAQKQVFVTGGDKGIGRAIVELFAENNYMVFFSYKSNTQGANDLSERFQNTKSIQCDLASQVSVDRAVRELGRVSGGIDILVNNAGIDHDCMFSKMDFKTWHEVLHVNLIQVYHFSHALLSHMVGNNWGRIVNLASIGAYTSAFGKTNYAASKAGIVGFTRALALEVAKEGITVNAISPGAIDTDMLHRIPQKYKDQLISQIPAKRIGRPQEVAELVFFLCGDKASFITGQTIHINGGQFLS